MNIQKGTYLLGESIFKNIIMQYKEGKTYALTSQQQQIETLLTEDDLGTARSRLNDVMMDNFIKRHLQVQYHTRLNGPDGK